MRVQSRVPNVPTGLTVGRVGRSRVELSWSVPLFTAECVCYYEMVVVGASNDGRNRTSQMLTPIRTTQNAFVLCDALPDATYNVSLRAVSVRGSSAYTFSGFVTASTAGPVDTDTQCTQVTQIAGTWPETMPSQYPVGVAVFGILMLFMVLCVPIVMHQCVRTTGVEGEDTSCGPAMRQSLVVRTCLFYVFLLCWSQLLRGCDCVDQLTNVGAPPKVSVRFSRALCPTPTHLCVCACVVLNVECGLELVVLRCVGHDCGCIHPFRLLSRVSDHQHILRV
jgi:hypothetical protein